jgi:hypothetical protein
MCSSVCHTMLCRSAKSWLIHARNRAKTSVRKQTMAGEGGQRTETLTSTKRLTDASALTQNHAADVRPRLVPDGPQYSDASNPRATPPDTPSPSLARRPPTLDASISQGAPPMILHRWSPASIRGGTPLNDPLSPRLPHRERRSARPHRQTLSSTDSLKRTPTPLFFTGPPAADEADLAVGSEEMLTGERGEGNGDEKSMTEGCFS